MFDIGFAELLIIGLVGLIVIGPDRLPETIRTLALWIGRTRRTFSQFRKDLEQEIGADEIRQELRNEDIMAQLKETQQQLHQALDVDKSIATTQSKDNKTEQGPLNTPTAAEKNDE